MNCVVVNAAKLGSLIVVMTNALFFTRIENGVTFAMPGMPMSRRV